MHKVNQTINAATTRLETKQDLTVGLTFDTNV